MANEVPRQGQRIQANAAYRIGVEKSGMRERHR
jgi:hypothetical protein